MTTPSLVNVLYTAHTHVTGGRNGTGTSSDGELDVKLSHFGSSQSGTNPEQLFGVGYSACFLSAIELAAAARKTKLPADASVDAAVSLGQIASGEYQLGVTLTVNLPGLDDELKRELVATAHQTCPYSRLTRGNVDVEHVVA